MFFSSGTNGDFNKDFFQTTASTLTGTMLINSYMPFMYFGVYWLIQYTKVMIDRSFKCCPSKEPFEDPTKK